MKRIVVFGIVLVALSSATWMLAVEPETRTLAGEYVWSGAGKSGDLEAVFTPTGEKAWDVAFHFDFRGKHVYSGTATGSLMEGELSGKVFNEDKNRTFTFTGRFEEGKFRGTHSEIEDGAEEATGTLTLAN
jgi:hypothetical protein